MAIEGGDSYPVGPECPEGPAQGPENLWTVQRQLALVRHRYGARSAGAPTCQLDVSQSRRVPGQCRAVRKVLLRRPLQYLSNAQPAEAIAGEGRGSSQSR